MGVDYQGGWTGIEVYRAFVLSLVLIDRLVPHVINERELYRG
jgi:hypothetical protein